MKKIFIIYIFLSGYNVYSQDTIIINDSKWVGSLHNGIRNGLWQEYAFVEYFNDYRLLSEGYFVNDKEHGAWKFFGLSHQGDMELRAQGNFANGKKEGEWIHDRGYYYCKGKYKNGLKQGKWLCYDREVSDSLIHTKQNYVDGIPEGIWELYHSEGSERDGTLRASGQMSKGQMIGLWKTSGCVGELRINPDTVIYSPNLSKLVYDIEEDCEALYGTDNKIGEWKYFYDGTTLLSGTGKYINGKKEGVWKMYHPNGVSEYEGVYHEGKKEGIWKEYYDNGNLKCIETYVAGQLNGDCSFYTEDGHRLITGQFTHGYRSGEWKSYLNDSIVRQKGYYDGLQDNPRPDRPSHGNRCGLEESKYEIESILNSNSHYLPISNRQGIWKEYDFNGVLKERGAYIHSKKDGQWEHYHNGFLTSLYNYSNGFMDGEFVEFNWHWAYVWKQGEYKNGKIITQHEFNEGEGLTKEAYFKEKGYIDIPK
jgi:antitoxin component YwqK of YwqJK toxin-antitoxin module